MIWLTDKFREAEISMAGKICKSKLIPWYDKSVLVSSLTLSLVRHFDIQKVNLLFDFFEEGENQVWQRALIGLFLGLYFHDYRLNYYPEITNRLEAARESTKLEKNIEAIVIQGRDTAGNDENEINPRRKTRPGRYPFIKEHR